MSEKNIIITASIMVSLFGTVSCPELPLRPAMAQTIEIKEVDRIYETDEWKEIQSKWENMNNVKAANFEQISQVVEEKRKDLEQILAHLIEKGYLSGVCGKAITIIYGENLRTSLEGKVDLPSCYKPMMIEEWDCNGADTREEINKKLSLLEECYKKGSIKKEVYESVKKDIKARLSLLDKADEYWKNQKHPREIDVLLHLYDQNAGGIKEGKDVSIDLIKASEYIVKLEK